MVSQTRKKSPLCSLTTRTRRSAPPPSRSHRRRVRRYRHRQRRYRRRRRHRHCRVRSQRHSSERVRPSRTPSATLPAAYGRTGCRVLERRLELVPWYRFQFHGTVPRRRGWFRMGARRVSSACNRYTKDTGGWVGGGGVGGVGGVVVGTGSPRLTRAWAQFGTGTVVPVPVPRFHGTAPAGWFRGCAEGTECLQSLYKGHWWVGGGCGRYRDL